MSGRHLLAAFVLSLLVCCCGGSAQTRPHTLEPGTVPGDRNPALKAPASVVELIPPQNPQAFYFGRYLYGAYAAQQGLCSGVTAEDHRLRFEPDWRGGEGEMAYAIFGFNMTYFQGEGSIVLEWAGDAPADGSLLLGLGNFEQNRWEWYAGSAEPLEVDSLAPYQDSELYLLCAVVVLGNEPVLLDGLRIGEEVLQEGVDMLKLCAPPLDCEVTKLRNEFSGRSPVEQDYTYVTQLIEGQMTWAVVSHEVDNLTHYGILRIPPAQGDGLTPVLLLCHPGVNGASIWGLSWLANVVDDDDLLDQFLVVQPSFRGEPAYGDTMGSFKSDGQLNLYDRDSDDALALLDCVLNHFPQARQGDVVAAGWSRGAQVALRAAQRDARIGGVLEFAGWTDEWTIGGQAYAYYALPELAGPPQPGDLMYAYDSQLWLLKIGACDVWDMREVMLRMSVNYCASDLPRVQLHYGELDTGVPIEQGQNLAAWLEWVGNTESEYYSYPDGTHQVTSMTGAGPRARDFLTSFLPD
jgi:pimeloyl-ACP methyl ester carboxylesterase